MLSKQSSDDAAFALAGLAGDGDVAATRKEFCDALTDCGKLGSAADEAVDAIIDEAGVVGEAGAELGRARFCLEILESFVGGIIIIRMVVDHLASLAQLALDASDCVATRGDLADDIRVCMDAHLNLLRYQCLEHIAVGDELLEQIVDDVVVWHGISSVGLPSTPLAEGGAGC